MSLSSDQDSSSEVEEETFIPSPTWDDQFVLLSKSGIFTSKQSVSAFMKMIDDGLQPSTDFQDLLHSSLDEKRLLDNEILEPYFTSLLASGLYKKRVLMNRVLNDLYTEENLNKLVKENFEVCREKSSNANERKSDLNANICPFYKHNSNIVMMKQNVNALLISLFVHENISYKQVLHSDNPENARFYIDLVCGPKYQGFFNGTMCTVSSDRSSDQRRILDCMHDSSGDGVLQMFSNLVIYLFPYMIGRKELDDVRSSNFSSLPSQGPDGERLEISSLYNTFDESIPHLESKGGITVEEVNKLFATLKVS